MVATSRLRRLMPAFFGISRVFWGELEYWNILEYRWNIFPFAQLKIEYLPRSSSRNPDLPRKSRLVTRTCLTQTGAGTSLDFFLAFSVVAALWKEMTNALEGDWNVIGGTFRGSRRVLLG